MLEKTTESNPEVSGLFFGIWGLGQKRLNLMRKGENYIFWDQGFFRNLLLGLFFGFVLTGCVKKADRMISVGVFVTVDTKTSSEIIAMKSLLEQIENIEIQYLQVDENVLMAEALSDFDLLWIHHRNPTGFPEEFTSTNFAKTIGHHIENGGKLLLTMYALQLLPVLGLEQQAPDNLTVEAVDRGYGRQLGFHAYLDHPLFAGMNGGAYIFNPEADTTTIQTGYFDPDYIPQGKIIAVDWSYITFHEDKKLILEYKKGKGSVLAIGAYLDFSIENKNKDEFGLFIKNTIHYLHNPIPEKINYWNYSYGEVIEYEPNLPKIEIPSSKKWEIRQNELSYNSDAASDDFWDLTGERMMVMGDEKAGIDEIWLHPFMALRDYEVGVIENGKTEVFWLRDVTPSISINPEAIKRTYRLRSGTLTEFISVHHEKPTTAIHYELEGESLELVVQIKSNMRLMWPYSHKVLGSLKYGYDEGSQSFVISDVNENFTTMVGFNQNPKTRLAGQFDGFDLKNDNFDGIATELLQVGAVAIFGMTETLGLDVVISASDFNDPKVFDYHAGALRNPFSVYQNSRDYYAGLLDNKLMINTPDAALNRDYRWALIGADRHFAHTPGIGRSLLAGIGTTARGWDGRHEINGRPGYAWYFGRDGQWSGFAINGYGDFGKVRDILTLFIKYQALNGKIFHELTTSGAVHYDAADATPLFVVLMGKYLRASGDLEFIRKNRESIQKAMNFCYSTDTDLDGLIENTGVGHGWVEGGFLFGGKTTIYLASCWAAALEEAAYMAAALKEVELCNQYLTDSEKVKAMINNQFFNDSLGFFNHSLKPDNTFITENTIMPAIPMYFGHIDPEKAQSSMDDWASNNFTANWGVRIVGEDNPKFHPEGYHSGSVWPLYTGWVALAEYKNGRPAQGFSHVMSTINIKNHWAKGFVEEVMHGSVYKPRGVCAHQCWSETMILQPLIDGMIGYEPNAVHNTLRLSPAVSANWDYYTFDNIPVGNERIGLTMQRTDKKIQYDFKYTGPTILKVNFQPQLPPGTKISGVNFNGVPVEFNIMEKSDAIILQLEFEMIHNPRFEIFYTGGIAVLPIIQNPKPGDSAGGLRIINAEIQNNLYTITLEAPAGTQAEISVFQNFPEMKNIENGRLISVEGKIAKIAVEFPEKGKYVVKKLILKI